MRSFWGLFGLYLIAVGLVVLGVLAGARAAGDSGAGKGVYHRYCAKCHGADGKGDGPLATYLRTKPTDFTDRSRMEKRTDEFLAKVVENGGAAEGLSPEMPAFKESLSAADVANVVAYIRGLAGSTGGKDK